MENSRVLLSLLLCAVACGGYTDESRRFADPVDGSQTFPLEVHEPAGLGVVDEPIVSAKGRKIAAGTACETCHGRQFDPDFIECDEDPCPEGPTLELETYHTSVEVEHGTLSCFQCHDADRTKLHLADGTLLGFIDVVQLCAQCHGPQYRNYLRTVHGGLNGYWDRNRGPQLHNNCVDCHDPHSPAFPPATPVLRPRDRYLTESGGH